VRAHAADALGDDVAGVSVGKPQVAERGPGLVGFVGGKELIARRGLDPRGAAFSREELATWRDVAGRGGTWRSMSLCDGRHGLLRSSQ
jgi:hypothetical protein